MARTRGHGSDLRRGAGFLQPDTRRVKAGQAVGKVAMQQFTNGNLGAVDALLGSLARVVRPQFPVLGPTRRQQSI
jgi:hypothetical protein